MCRFSSLFTGGELGEGEGEGEGDDDDDDGDDDDAAAAAAAAAAADDDDVAQKKMRKHIKYVFLFPPHRKTVFLQKLTLFGEIWRRDRSPAIRLEISQFLVNVSSIFVKFVKFLCKVKVFVLNHSLRVRVRPGTCTAPASSHGDHRDTA